MKCEVIAFNAGVLCARHLANVLCQLTVKLPNNPTGGEESGLWRLDCWSLNLGFATRPTALPLNIKVASSSCLTLCASGTSSVE